MRGQGIAIPVCHARDLSDLPDHPVVLRGFQPKASCHSLDDLLAASGTSTVHGYQASGGDAWVEMPAAEAVAAFSAGRLPINVVDLPVGANIGCGDRLDVPALMSNGNLLLSHPDWTIFQKSLVITQAGTVTPMHVDACGFAGWMYLFAGRKRWEFWEPTAAPLFYDLLGERYYDAGSGHPHPTPHCAAALADLPVWRGEIGPGELLWFPEGWLHRVETLADSYGYGGSTLHAARAAQAVQAWLWERRLGFSATSDLTDILRPAVKGNDAASRDLEALIDRAQTLLAGWSVARQ